MDSLINLLLECKNQEEFAQAVSANVTAFDTQFWLRLAARVDTTADTEEQERLRSLANTVMVLVDKMMKATEQQLENSGQVVQEILRAGSNANDEWDVPMKDAQVASMRQAMVDRGDMIDEAFLSACFTYIKKASDDNIHEIVHALQKILQIHAAHELTQRETDSEADALLNDIFQADEAKWEGMIEEYVSNGEISETSFTEALQKRMEGTVLGLQSGSYTQRVQAEYLKEVEERGKKVFAKLASA